MQEGKKNLLDQSFTRIKVYDDMLDTLKKSKEIVTTSKDKQEIEDTIQSVYYQKLEEKAEINKIKFEIATARNKTESSQEYRDRIAKFKKEWSELHGT